MKTQVNVTVTDALQDYANGKIEHVHKLLQQRKIDEVTREELELKVEKNPEHPLSRASPRRRCSRAGP